MRETDFQFKVLWTFVYFISVFDVNNYRTKCLYLHFDWTIISLEGWNWIEGMYIYVCCYRPVRLCWELFWATFRFLRQLRSTGVTVPGKRCKWTPWRSSWAQQELLNVTFWCWIFADLWTIPWVRPRRNRGKNRWPKYIAGGFRELRSCWEVEQRRLSSFRRSLQLNVQFRCMYLFSQYSSMRQDHKKWFVAFLRSIPFLSAYYVKQYIFIDRLEVKRSNIGDLDVIILDPMHF